MWGDRFGSFGLGGGCIKKAGGSKCVEICTFWTVIAFLGGQGQCVRD